MDNDNEFGFKVNIDFDDYGEIYSSSAKGQEFEDISSDTNGAAEHASTDYVDFSSFSRGETNMARRKKRGLAGFFHNFNIWWHDRKGYQKVLLILLTGVFTLACLYAIWTFMPLELRGKLFCSAFGLLVLNLGVWLCIHWKKRALQTVLMSFISLLLTGVLILTLFFWLPFLGAIYNFDHEFQADDLSAVPAIDKNITNIALFGIDTREDLSFKGNSDSIMILSLNAKNDTIKIISVLRDSLVPIDNNGKTIYSKVNSAYSRGGPELAVKTLNQIFDLDITEYATVNFFGMAQIIDAVGGIDVELTEREVRARGNNNHGINDMILEACQILGYNASDYYVTKSGVQHLNGIQAVAYSRIRYVANIWGNSNDYGRTERQRYVMEQLFNKALTMKKTEYPSLIKALIPYTVTSLSPDEILGFALNIMLGSPSFEQARIPHDDCLMTAPSGNFGSVVYYDLDFAAELIHNFIYEDTEFDEYIELNGVSKNDWYRNRFGSSSGSSGSSGSTNKNNSSNSVGSSSTDSGSSNKQPTVEEEEIVEKPNEDDTVTELPEEDKKPTDGKEEEENPDNGNEEEDVTDKENNTTDKDTTDDKSDDTTDDKKDNTDDNTNPTTPPEKDDTQNEGDNAG